MFDSILVANRGEIALRIMRTAQAMGIQTIAIYVEADKDAPHVRFADKAVLLPDGGYLDIDAVLDAAQKVMLALFIQDMVSYQKILSSLKESLKKKLFGLAPLLKSFL